MPRSVASDLGLVCQCPFYWPLCINGLKMVIGYELTQEMSLSRFFPEEI